MKLAIGDRVAYSVQFLRSVGMSHTYMAEARGVVRELRNLSTVGTECVLACVDWKNDYCGELPLKVNTANLAKVGPNRRFCNVD